MTEILFRGKRVDNREWVEGYVLHDAITGQWFIHEKSNSLNESSKTGEEGIYRFVAYEVDSETICQWTGIADSENKKVWEGDIIKYHFGDGYARIEYGCYKNCWDNKFEKHMGFYLVWPDEYSYLRKDLGYWIGTIALATVGNIFDNPELLQEVAHD